MSLPRPSELKIELGTMRLAALEWAGGGQPALALHGWLDNAASFSRLAPRIEGLHVVAPDLPGHGQSDWLPAAAFYHFIDSVSYVAEAVDALGWNRFSLIGHSMGAGIATLAAAALSDRVDRLVLIEGVGPLADEPAAAVERLVRSLGSESRIRSSSPRVFDGLDAAIAARRKGTELDEASARVLVNRGTEQRDGGWVFRHDPALKISSRVRLTEDQTAAFLRAIRCPVLAIRAESGWPFPEDVLRQRCALIEDLQRVDLPGDHHLHLTDPEPVAAVISRFFRS